MAIGLLVPAFNEAKKIGDVLGRLPEQMDGREVVVLVIDDGSTDDTAKVAAEHGAEVVAMAENGGKGRALRRGMEEAKGRGFEIIVWMDSDGQHDPADLGNVLAPVISGEADMVVGSRYLRPSRHQAPLNRRVVRAATVRAIKAITGQNLTDPFSGYRAFSSEAAERVELCGDRYESELEALFCVSRADLGVVEVPIDRIYGPDMSKMGFHRGRIRGRMTVVAGYAKTIVSGWTAKNERARLTVGQ